MDATKDKNGVQQKNCDDIVKRKKNKPKNTENPGNSESQVKRSIFTHFGSRRKKKETTVTDSGSTNNKNLMNQISTNTENDAGVNNPATNEINDEPVTGLMITEAHAEEYFMGYPRRGKAVIFNHENFDKEDAPREGTKVDVDRIKTVFEQLKFEIIVHTDLDYIHLMHEVIALSQEDYRDCDCIAIFVLTHGKKGGLLSAKDMYYPADKLWENFAGDKCTSLAGKPKLFFISACRGQKKDSGIRLFRGRTQADSSAKPVMYKIPNQADFLIANSTVEGYYSYRDIYSGTWFIQCLCDVLLDYHNTKDLLHMLTITCRKIATDYRTVSETRENCDLVQIPSITTMLIRDVYFRSK